MTSQRLDSSDASWGILKDMPMIAIGSILAVNTRKAAQDWLLAPQIRLRGGFQNKGALKYRQALDNSMTLFYKKIVITCVHPITLILLTPGMTLITRIPCLNR